MMPYRHPEKASASVAAQTAQTAATRLSMARLGIVALALCGAVASTACGGKAPRPMSNGPVTRVYLGWGSTPMLMACYDPGRGWWNTTAGCVPEATEVPDGRVVFTSATAAGRSEPKCAGPEKIESTLPPEALAPFFAKMTTSTPKPLEILQAVRIDLDGDGRPEELTVASSEAYEAPGHIGLSALFLKAASGPILLTHSLMYFMEVQSGDCTDVDGDGHPEFVLTDGGESERVDFLVEWDGRRLVHLGSVALGD